MIDLHVHSCRSDGTMTPTELVDYAIKKGLSAFALTDHDCVDGIPEALQYAQKLRDAGVENVPEIIPGVELSTEYNDTDVHIVGLYIDYNSENFKKYLRDFIESREKRNKKICEKMTNDGILISYEELVDHFPGAILTRAHFAALLLEKGYVKSKKEAFERFIGDRCPYHLKREHITPEEGVDLILSAGGIPVFAHPILCRFSDSHLEKLVASLKSHGLIGIEAFYSTYAPSEERQILRLSEKYHLLPSGGSDFHGSNKEKIDLGTGLGKLYVDDSILTNLNKARKKILFSDMDGTLLLNDSTISKEMHDALRAMMSCGHKLVLTSGRPLPSILERINLLDLNMPGMYIISNNGALIYDVDNNVPLRSYKLSSDIIAEICEMADSMGVHVHSYTDSEIVGFSEDEELDFYRQRIHMPFVKTNDIAAFLNDGSYKVQLIHLTDHALMEKLREEILCKLGDKVEAMFSSSKYLEVLPKGVDKGDAVAFLTDYFPVLRCNTFASGDEMNDIPMIRAAHTGIAMANANDKVKAVADVVTKETNDHDGLLEIISMFS